MTPCAFHEAFALQAEAPIDSNLCRPICNPFETAQCTPCLVAAAALTVFVQQPATGRLGVRVFGAFDIPQLGGQTVSIQIATLDASDEELAASPVLFCNGRDDDWWNAPAISSYL